MVKLVQVGVACLNGSEVNNYKRVVYTTLVSNGGNVVELSGCGKA